MRSLPTPSALERAVNCVVSEALPHVQTTTEGATFGQHLHRFLQDVPELGMEVALERASEEHREAFAKVDLSRLPASAPETYRPEMAFAYDLDTHVARVLATVKDRQYSGLAETEIAGTVDTHAVLDDSVVVYDYKSNWAPAAAPADNWQLKAYALMVARATGRRRARIGIIRVPEHGDPFFRVDELDEAALDAFEVELCGVLERVLITRAEAELLGPERLLATHEGPWCRYCPALPYCPSKTGQLRAVLATPEEAERGLLEALDDKKVALAWSRVEAARKLLDRVHDVLVKYVDQRPAGVPMPNGTVLARVERKRESVVGSVVYTVLAETYGQDVAEAAAPVVPESREATKKSIESALRIAQQRIPGAKITKLKETALEAIRVAGGVSSKEWTEVDEVKPEKLLAANAGGEKKAS